jgi:hypothetical protein
METPLSLSKPPRRFTLHRACLLTVLVLVAALPLDNVFAVGLFSLSLMLIVARGLFAFSLKELAFCSFAIIAAGVIWPGAHLAISNYNDSGFVALAAFMAFVFVLAVTLAVLAAYLLANHDGEE